MRELPILDLDRFHTRRLGTDDLGPLQALLEQCSRDFQLMWGMPPGPREAEVLLSEAPPGRSAAEKYVVGILGPSGGLAAVLELVAAYPGEGDWWIGLFLVGPGLRGRGLGSAVVDAVGRWIVDEGGRWLWLCVQEQNGRAHAFWRRQGFAEVRRERQHLRGRENEVLVMRRQLASGQVTPTQRSDGVQGIEAVTFDFFNTLVTHRRGDGGRGAMLMEYLRSQGLECDPWEHQALYDVLKPHGREYAPDLPPADKHRYLCGLAERVFERLNVRSEIHEARRHAGKIWELIGPSSLAVFPEVPRTLERLRAAGYRLAVVSNWQCGLAHFCVELGIGNLFAHVVASAEIGYAKPGREIFEEACRRLAVPPDRVLHVGDTPEDDVEGARGAGMRAVLVRRQGEDAEGMDGAIRRLDGVLQLLGLGQGKQLGGPREMGEAAAADHFG